MVIRRGRMVRRSFLNNSARNHLDREAELKSAAAGLVVGGSRVHRSATLSGVSTVACFCARWTDRVRATRPIVVGLMVCDGTPTAVASSGSHYIMPPLPGLTLAWRP
jgi:hypothetical protein